MVSFFPLLVMVVAIVVAVGTHVRNRQERRGLAAACGMEFEPATLGHPDRMVGTRRGRPVTVAWVTRGRGRTRALFTQWSVGGVAPGITLKGQGIGNELLRRVSGGEDLLTGDANFDAAVIVQGDPTVLTTVLDADTRRKVLALPDGAVVTDGALSWETPGHPESPDILAFQLDDAVGITQRLAFPADPSDRLAAIAAGDWCPGVRRRALRVLAAKNPASGGAVAQRLLSDTDPTVRMQAALTLGQVEALAAGAALATLATEVPDAVARALVRTRSEAALLSLLTVDEAPVRLAAARGLARVGTVRAVEPLLALTRGFLLGDEVKSAAQTAIDSIQARATESGAGQVSIVDGEAGRISVANEAGRVSVSPRRGR